MYGAFQRIRLAVDEITGNKRIGMRIPGDLNVAALELGRDVLGSFRDHEDDSVHSQALGHGLPIQQEFLS